MCLLLYRPTIIFSLLLNIIQLQIAKFALLQERGKYLALNNRRFFHILSFFLFFFNVIIGVFGCLKRILLSVVLGALFISRTDRCLLLKGFEFLDAGHNAYLGMLKLELYHNHPILRFFCLMLLEERKSNISYNSDAYKMQEKVASGSLEHIDPQLKKRQIKFRWWRCFTLINNPDLILDIKRQQYKEERKKKNKEKNEKIKLSSMVPISENEIIDEKIERKLKNKNEYVISNSDILSDSV